MDGSLKVVGRLEGAVSVVGSVLGLQEGFARHSLAPIPHTIVGTVPVVEVAIGFLIAGTHMDSGWEEKEE